MNTPVTQTLTQEVTPVTPVGKVSVYFCGGTGANVNDLLKQQIATFNRSGMADLHPFVIDTSTSNLATLKDNVYIYKGLDGFGKKRDEDPQAIKKKIPEILSKFEPQEFNIVVGSISGGSGSIIMPLVVRELLAMGKGVIVLGVVSTDTDTEIENASDTLGNLEKITQSTGRPVIFRPCVNPPDGNQAEVDKSIVLDIMMLAMLFSRRNARLDQSDLRNWLDYHRLTKAPVKLVSMLTLTSGEAGDLEDGLVPISVATIAPLNTSTRAPWPVGYQATGFVSGKAAEQIKGAVHFTVVDGEIAKLYDTLDSELKRLQATSSGTNFAKTLPTNKGGLSDMF